MGWCQENVLGYNCNVHVYNKKIRSSPLVKFVYNISLLVFVLGALVACDESLDFENSKMDNSIKYNMVDFLRTGGECLEDPKTTEGNERCARVEVRYPEIETTPVEDMREQLNGKIQEIMLSSIDDETKPDDIEQMAYLFIQRYKKELEHGAKNWSLDKTIEILLNTPQIISFQINESGYTGGPHGYNNIYFMNIDLDIMQEVKLADLLLPGYEAELNITGEVIFREIREIPTGADLKGAGFEFENNQFSLNDKTDRFAVTDKGLLFYFNNYEIAPYVDGPTEVLIPYTKIQNLIDPNGLLSMHVKSTLSTSEK